MSMMVVMFFVSLVVPVSNPNPADATFTVTFVTRMFSMSVPLYNSFESFVRVRSVFHNTVCAIRFLQGVSTVYMMPVPVFMLLFFVMCVRIVYTVLKLVMSLPWKKNHKILRAIRIVVRQMHNQKQLDMDKICIKKAVA
ncbi:hypothetical protein NQ315_002465 [Exocentrus adspersus]|uniref:Uncharacterized protein n=1 Tax=Exocentrus adspersus TaxID=1586481 RepID=A0AAV8VKV5_9CUCU|nr:hypothetical protein NQ315_002465 [Exocentrus adspersus]